MAVQRYMKYQYETSPRKLEPEYKRQQKKYPKKSTAPKKKLSTKAVKAKKRDRVRLVVSLVAIFASIFAISYRSSQIDEAFTKNEEMKQAYLELQKENDQMNVEIENSLNLANVEQQAKELLGMQKLSAKQTVYVNLPKKDYIQPATENVVEKKEDSFIDSIMNKLKSMF